MKKTSLINTIRTIVFVILIFLLYKFTLQVCVVNGSSMNNTLNNNQMLVQSKLKNATYGDIVSIYSDTLDELLCKRVIAMHGDKVVIKGIDVYVNDNLLYEPYAYYDYEPNTEYSFIVDEGCVFVMGDNRNHSTDSRYLGSISMKNIRSVYMFNLSDILHADYNTIQTTLKIIWVILFVVWIITNIKFKNKVENKEDEQIEINSESK